MKAWTRIGALVTLGMLLTASLPAAAQGESSANPSPVGTWLLTVNFLSGNPPPFKELVTLHAGGTVSETNATLSAASGLLPPPFNLIGSDGQGHWQRLPGGKTGITITKIVFCGAASVAFCSPGQEGQQFGYLRVTLSARIDGGTLTVDAADAQTVLILGPDPAGPQIDFGPASSTGIRLR